MDNFSDLQQLWQSVDPKPKQSAEEIIALVRKQQRQIVIRTMGSILALIATIPVMLWVFVDYHPRYPTTRVSIIMILIAVLGGIVLQSRMLRMLRMVREDTSNEAMITTLKRVQLRQHKLNTVGMSVYFAMLSVSMAFYLAEFVSGNIMFGIISFGLTFGWIAFAWFYLRKRGIKRQNARLESMIKLLESLHED